MGTQEISIIICTYNGANRLPKVLEKIYKQNNLRKYVKEVIIVDNHSTDTTRKVVKNEIELRNIVPLRYLYEDNPGLSNARKKGVDSCTTKWIVFLDDDNWINVDWIHRIAHYIETHPKVGVINGAVIPYLSFNATDEEKMRLSASLKVLACSHISIDELKKKQRSPFRNPIGAGMVIRTAPLKELSENGWLNSSGRTKDKLTSGEDGEMAFYVKNKGFDFGFCPDAILFHDIPQNRLNEAYLEKIWFEIGRGVAVVAKRQKRNLFFLWGYRLILQLRLFAFLLTFPLKGKYYRKYIEGYDYEM